MISARDHFASVLDKSRLFRAQIKAYFSNSLNSYLKLFCKAEENYENIVSDVRVLFKFDRVTIHVRIPTVYIV